MLISEMILHSYCMQLINAKAGLVTRLRQKSFEVMARKIISGWGITKGRLV